MKLEWAIKKQTNFSIDEFEIRHKGNNHLMFLIHRKMSCEVTINPRIYFLSSVLDISRNWKLKVQTQQQSKDQITDQN